MQKKSNVRKWIACIEAYDEDSAKDLAERMTKIFPGALASTGKNRMKWKNPKKKQSIAWR